MNTHGKAESCFQWNRTDQFVIWHQRFFSWQVWSKKFLKNRRNCFDFCWGNWFEKLPKAFSKYSVWEITNLFWAGLSFFYSERRYFSDEGMLVRCVPTRCRLKLRVVQNPEKIEVWGDVASCWAVVDFMVSVGKLIVWSFDVGTGNLLWRIFVHHWRPPVFIGGLQWRVVSVS